MDNTTVLDNPAVDSSLNGPVVSSDIDEYSARKLITELTERDGNDVCADCGERSEYSISF